MRSRRSWLRIFPIEGDTIEMAPSNFGNRRLAMPNGRTTASAPSRPALPRDGERSWAPAIRS